MKCVIKNKSEGVNTELTADDESLVNPGTTTMIGVVSFLEIELFMCKAPPETVK